MYSIRFWQYVGLIILGNVFQGFFSYSFKVFGEDSKGHEPISDVLLTLAISIGGGLFNGGSRIIMGFLQDIFPFKILLAILFSVYAVLAASIYWLVNFPALYFIAILTNYFCTGGMYAIFPGSVNNCFGTDFAPQIYSLILIGGFISAVINFLLSQFLFPAFGFFYCFMLCLVI